MQCVAKDCLLRGAACGRLQPQTASKWQLLLTSGCRESTLPSFPPLSATARTDNRHLNCHGRQTRPEREQDNSKGLSQSQSQLKKRLRKEGGAKKKEKEQTIRRILVFCSRFAGHIKNIFNLTAANVFTPCCHMLNGQAG